MQISEEILTEDDKRIQELSRQYINQVRFLKQNEAKIAFKKKLRPVFVIEFFYTWIAIVIATFKLFENELFQTIFGFLSIGITFYVYGIFAFFYLREDIDKSDNIIKNIDNIQNELNQLLEKINLNVDDFYKELDKKI